MLEWDYGPKLAGADFYLDSRRPRAVSFISHAHSDHMGLHKTAIATKPTLALAEARYAMQASIELPYDGSPHGIDARHRLTLHPAGHVLGSAMIRIERDDAASLLYTGDFKIRSGPTVIPANAPRADVLVMESTYGKPLFRFPPWRDVAARLVETVTTALREGCQPIVMGYSLGKAQQIVHILTSAGLTVTEHGAVAKLSNVYEAHGVSLGKRRQYHADDFHGPNALSLEERGVIVAPPQVARSNFVNRFNKRLCVMMSGWALLKGAEYRYGVDCVLPMSDHADFDELMELIEIVKPKRVLTLHGFPEFVDTLRSRGIRADLAKPDPQLQLFG